MTTTSFARQTADSSPALRYYVVHDGAGDPEGLPAEEHLLGQATPTMTSHYGKILHSTLVRKATAFHQAQEHNRTQRGLTQPTDVTVERLRAKFTAVLPNGYCRLPASKTC